MSATTATQRDGIVESSDVVIDVGSTGPSPVERLFYERNRYKAALEKISGKDLPVWWTRINEAWRLAAIADEALKGDE